MKTLKQLYDYPGGENCNFIDSRDKLRLLDFIPVQDWEKFGFKPTPNAVDTKPIKFTLGNVLKALERDLAFAFEKALNKRGISSNLMYDVIKMWMWVLDDDLYNHTNYTYYGLPLYKKVAIKYNFNNPIGEDFGNEFKYSNN